jgi:hypothetical protein
MARRSRESIAGTFDLVGIAVALGVGERNRLGGDEFVQRNAPAVGGDVAVFRVSNLQKVHANTRQADGLSGRRTFIGGGHLLQIEAVHEKEEGSTDEKADKEAHIGIVARPVAFFKRRARRVALGTTGPILALNCVLFVRLLPAAAFPSPV